MSDLLRVNIHIFDISSGSGVFIHHTPKMGYRDHFFLLMVDNHFHAISKIDPVLRNFMRNCRISFCFNCYRMKDSRYEHRCDQGDDTIIPRFYECGDMLLKYFPQAYEEREM